ncbi:MAG: hypothetical protein VB081_06670 [Christensenella sp.]|uniref:hypothetical protein n=1 Tax=Christensenella sp. TaxID=1935934 RepID=UPI002B2150A5|nr:hypothetical protein [Christensenella sp.]MEA5003166.1 hypothetical protein [Christensenella sp.]
MKKILMVTFAALLLLSLVACSAPVPEASPITPESEAPAEDAASPSAGSESPTDGADDPSAMTPLYGKVKSLVGNELTLDLAKQPEGSSESVEGGGEGGDASIAAEAPSISITTHEGEDVGKSSAEGGEPKVGYYSADGSGDVQFFDNMDDMPKIELEYTGETKDLTVPAGLKIYDMMGKELKMSDLKEGNVLMILQKEDGSIESITVLE